MRGGQHEHPANELVSIRAMTGGMTSAAAISVTPSTFMLARIDEREQQHQQRVDAAGS